MFEDVKGIYIDGDCVVNLVSVINDTISTIKDKRGVCDIMLVDDRPVPIDWIEYDGAFKLIVHSSPHLGRSFIEELGRRPDNVSASIGPWGMFRLEIETSSWMHEDLCDLLLTNPCHMPTVDVDFDPEYDYPFTVRMDGIEYTEALKWRLIHLGIKGLEILDQASAGVLLDNDDIELIKENREELGIVLATQIVEKAETYLT